MASTSRRNSGANRTVRAKINLAFIDFGNFLAADRGLTTELISLTRRPWRAPWRIYPNDQVGLAEQIETGGVGDPRTALSSVSLTWTAVQLDEVLPNILNRVLAFHAGHRFLDIVLDILREIENRRRRIRG